MGIEGFMILCAISAFAIATTIYLYIDSKNKKIVSEKSERINALLLLNKNVQFRTIQPSYSNHQICHSKRQLEHLSMDEYLIAQIASNEAFYRNIVQTIASNINQYNTYIQKANSLKSKATEEFCNTFGFTLDRFLKYEERVFQDHILHPQMDVEVHCKASYTSPKGKNHYWKKQSYHYKELRELLERTLRLKAQQQTRQYQIKAERAKMSDSLRYDILKRDNFRCQICGSTAQDGVKLHVDHIIPVSKGGRTVTSNLRTLCDRCNMGKGDKM